MLIDPALFRDDAVSAETRAFNAGLQQILSALPDMTTFTPASKRQKGREGKSWMGPIVYSDLARTITIEGPGGDLDLRVIDAGESDGVYLHLHGGGWVLGAADLSDIPNEAMARAAGVAVVSVEYRLAPEHPYPVGLDDCVAAAKWLIANSKAEFGTDRIVIGGESAGANLAAATLLRIRDEIGYTDWAGANLVYGSYLFEGTPSVTHWKTEGLVLDPDSMEWFGVHYLGGRSRDLKDPSMSPLYGVLNDMPSALFTVETWVPLLDDTLFMASRWIVAGNDADLAVYPGGTHAFDAFPTSIAGTARDRMHTFVRAAIDG